MGYAFLAGQAMKETPSVEFVLRGKVGGVDISPRTIGLSQFNEFNVQVETFVSGSQRLKLDEAHVEIREGSYVLRVLLPAVVLASLEPDLRLLAREDVLGELDFKRAEVLQKWQTRAKDDPGLSYEVRPRGDSLPRVRISHQTDYRIGEIVPWVAVEKYLFADLDSLKQEIAVQTSHHLTFEEIHEALTPQGRVVMFQIPAVHSRIAHLVEGAFLWPGSRSPCSAEPA